MNRVILLGGSLIIVGMLVACTSTETVVFPTEPIVISADQVAEASPSREVKLPGDSLGVYLGNMKLGLPGHSLSPGDIVDTWTELDTTPILGHKIGDPISLKIWNGYSSIVKMSVAWMPEENYIGRIPGTNTCEDSDGIYKIAPEYVKDWITFKAGRYEVTPKSILDMPFSLVVPKDATLKGRYILQLFISKSSEDPYAMGLIEAYTFKLKLDIE